MEHLLYSSNEMFSSTQLVRQSKRIFDQLSNNEISKAIILRDGKPNFMLLDFNRYEEVMSEFNMLKLFFEEHNSKVEIKTVVKESIVNKIEPAKEIINIDNKEVLIVEDLNSDELDLIKEQENLELKEALRQLDELNLDNDLKEEAKNKLLNEQENGQIKEFWN